MITDGRAIEVAGDHLEKRVGGEASYVVLGVEEEKPGLKFVSSKVINGNTERNITFVVDADAARVIDSGEFTDVWEENQKSELQEIKEAIRYCRAGFDELINQMNEKKTPQKPPKGATHDEWEYRIRNNVRYWKIYKSKQDAIWVQEKVKLWKTGEKYSTPASEEETDMVKHNGLYAIVYKDGQIIDKGKRSDTVKKYHRERTRLGKVGDYL